MSDQTNKHTHILIDTKYDMYMFFNFSFNIMYVYMFFKSINTYICLLIQNVLEVKWLHLRARWRWILSLHMFFPSTYNICMSFNVEKHTYMCFNTKHNIYMSCNSRIWPLCFHKWYLQDAFSILSTSLKQWMHRSSAQNTCKVHVTLTAKKMHIYIHVHTYQYAYICTRKHMCMRDTVHTLKHWYQDTQSMHKHAYTYTCTRV